MDLECSHLLAVLDMKDLDLERGSFDRQTADSFDHQAADSFDRQVVDNSAPI